MRQIGLRKVVLATVAFVAVFSVGWSDQHGISLSVESAQARARLYVAPIYYNPYVAGSNDTWYVVRTYYAGGPWSGTSADGLPYAWNGWDDYAARNGISCRPGTVFKGGDNINYVCQ